MADPKPGWRRFKFGDVVRLNKEKCKAPTAEGVERYVGLEHIEPGDLRVRSWGDVAEGTTFTNRIRPGQVLFAKRRAYQRKVAVADFDAVCSGDIYVFESSNSALLRPELLPFVCQTEAFFEFAVGTSAGSLSPRTNWSSLATYEFALPPLHEQVRAARLLMALEGAREALANMELALTGALDALAQWWATAGLQKLDARGVVESKALSNGWRLMSIRELCTGEGGGLTLGPFGSALKVEDYGHLVAGTPVLFVQDVGRFDLRHQSGRFVSASKHEELVGHEAVPGDVLVTEMGWPPGEACVVPHGWPASVIKADIIRARVNRSVVVPEYVELVLNSHWGQQQIVRISPGTTRPRMTLRDFEKLILAVPPSNEQFQAARQASDIRSRMRDARRRIESIHLVKNAALALALGTA
jgi:type I restriction enzyme S subunit